MSNIIPNDPMMLMSFINMKLRDEFQSLDELCLALGVEREEIETKLKQAGLEYNEALNKVW